MILLFLSLLSSTHSSHTCPCDVTPVTCDLNCCCDLSCTTDEIQSFTCQTYLLSDSKLCCKDELIVSPEGAYQSVRTCSNDIICLDETPPTFGAFSNTTISNSFSSPNQLLYSFDIEVVDSNGQYHDDDVLLQYTAYDIKVAPFLFPVAFYGDSCKFAPVAFYSNVVSRCRQKAMNVETLCLGGSVLDFNTYLTDELLRVPSTSPTGFLDLFQNVTVYCLDPVKNVKSNCTPDIPSIIEEKCINVIQMLEIKLKTQSDNMSLSESSVDITLTSVDLTVSTITQLFSLTYVPSIKPQTKQKSGNFGYEMGAFILSGLAVDKQVIMNADPQMRLLSLMSSKDCDFFESVPIKFGVNYYTGCKLGLQFYNFELMSTNAKEYCYVLVNITESIFHQQSGLVVGTTGTSSVEDISQWVYVQTEPPAPADDMDSAVMKCNDVTTHRTYKIFYTDVGEKDNVQSVITSVKVELDRQNVALYCGNNFCSSYKQQYIVLSNSVQFVYNPPSTVHRYKVRPTTTILLPPDFFYPLTSSVFSGGVGGYIVCLVFLYLGYYF